MKNSISIGLDLSLVGTGIVVLDKGQIIYQGLIKSKPVGDRPLDELKRIRKIVAEIKEVVGKHTPDVAIIENLAFAVRSTTALTQLAALNYFTRAVLSDLDIPWYLVAPTSLKKFATGNGASKKDVMLIEVFKRWGVTILNDNENDAYCLAQVGLCLLGHTEEVTKFQEEVVSLVKKQK